MVNVLYHIIPYCIILCRIVPYYTMLNHIIPYYTTSYHTIPYYTILYHYTYHCTFLYLSLWYYSYHVPYQCFNGDRGHRILPCFDHGACCILLWIWLITQWEPVLYWYNYIQPETMFQNSFRVDFITSTLGWLKSPSANIVLGSLWNSSFLTTPEIIVKSEEQQHSWSGTPSFYCFNHYRPEAKLRIKLWK